MSPTRSSTIFPFKHTYSTIPRGHSTTTAYLGSMCIKVCFIGQKEFSQRLASYFVFSCVHQQGYLGLQALLNPTIYNIIRWFAGTNDLSTKCLIIKALFLLSFLIDLAHSKFFIFIFVNS